MFLIRRRFRFSAAHRLTKVGATHKCARMHGHNYEVELELAATDVDGAGMVRDFGDLGPFRLYLDQHFDHRTLNDVLDVEPTAELVAHHLYRWASRHWPEVIACRVWESPDLCAEYRP